MTSFTNMIEWQIYDNMVSGNNCDYLVKQRVTLLYGKRTADHLREMSSLLIYKLTRLLREKLSTVKIHICKSKMNYLDNPDSTGNREWCCQDSYDLLFTTDNIWRKFHFNFLIESSDEWSCVYLAKHSLDLFVSLICSHTQKKPQTDTATHTFWFVGLVASA